MECAKCGVKVLWLNEYDLCSCCYADLEQDQSEDESDMEVIYGRGN